MIDGEVLASVPYAVVEPNAEVSSETRTIRPRRRAIVLAAASHERHRMSTYQFISYETTSEAIWLTLSRPERLNVLSSEVFEEIYDAFIRASLDDEHSIVVFRSSGRLFSAGGDQKSRDAKIMAGGYGVEGATEMYKHVLAEYPMFGAIETCPHTVIAAIHASAYGAAVDLSLMCDLMIVARGAELVFAPGKFGLADTPNSVRLPARVGVARAKDLIFTARPVGAEEAFAIGLATRLVDAEGFDEAVRTYVHDVMTTPALARRYVKELMHRNLPAHSPLEHFKTAIGPDYRNAHKAFLGKRPIPWTAKGLEARKSGAMDDLDLEETARSSLARR